MTQLTQKCPRLCDNTHKHTHTHDFARSAKWSPVQPCAHCQTTLTRLPSEGALVGGRQPARSSSCCTGAARWTDAVDAQRERSAAGRYSQALRSTVAPVALLITVRTLTAQQLSCRRCNELSSARARQRGSVLGTRERESWPPEASRTGKHHPVHGKKKRKVVLCCCCIFSFVIRYFVTICAMYCFGRAWELLSNIVLSNTKKKKH